MKKNDSKYFYTASLMNQALLLLLEVKDLEFISVTEITKKAGVNRSTFYLHYENIYDLFEETLENPAEMAIKVSDYHFGIGSDGLITIGPSKIADFTMHTTAYPIENTASDTTAPTNFMPNGNSMQKKNPPI